MNRRGFLGLLGAATAAGVVGIDLAELLAPSKTYFLPLRSGTHLFVPELWSAEIVAAYKRNLVLANHLNDLAIYGQSVTRVRFDGAQILHTRAQPVDFYRLAAPCQGDALPLS